VVPLFVLTAILAAGQPSPPQQAREVIVSIMVHANQVVPTEEVISIAGVKVGDAFTDKTVDEVTSRLKASRSASAMPRSRTCRRSRW
jgi:outer membrane protein assembly factor BamA